MWTRNFPHCKKKLTGGLVASGKRQAVNALVFNNQSSLINYHLKVRLSGLPAFIFHCLYGLKEQGFRHTAADRQN
jgi:hypothetical protein